MFERYTEKARRVIFFSRYEAAQRGSPYIETGHLLLGILREGAPLLRELGITTGESIAEDCRKTLESKGSIPIQGDLPLSNASKRVLSYAAEEAGQQSKWIGLQHLTMGSLREGDTASEILNRHGITIEKVRGLRAFEDRIPLPSAMASPGVQVEFVCDHELLGKPTGVAQPRWPRMGETVVFGDGEHCHAYIVTNITYSYERLEDHQIRMAKVVVTVKLSRSEPPTR